jgi:hypothetical protein
MIKRIKINYDLAKIGTTALLRQPFILLSTPRLSLYYYNKIKVKRKRYLVLNMKEVANNLFAFVYRKRYKVPNLILNRTRKFYKSLKKRYEHSLNLFPQILNKVFTFKNFFENSKRTYYLRMRAFFRPKFQN